MTEAAFAAAFSDGAHFTRTCQQMFGQPPQASSPLSRNCSSTAARVVPSAIQRHDYCCSQ